MNREDFLRFIWGEQRSLLVDDTFQTTTDLQQASFYLPSIATSREKTGFVQSSVLWVDYDQETLGENHIADPSIVVNSGGGSHLLWRLNQPIVNANTLEALNKIVANRVGGDNCWNANRILRLPGSINTKYYPIRSASVTRHSTDKFLSFTQVLAPNTKTRELINEVPSDRSNALFYVAAAFKDYGYDLEFISSIILPEYDKNWGKYTDRPEEYNRIVDKLRNQTNPTFAGLRNSIQQATPPVADTEPIGTSPALSTSTGGVGFSSPTTLQLRALSLNELLTHKIEIGWIIENILPEEGLLILTGPPGIGKTSVSIFFGMVLSRTAGEPDPQVKGLEILKQQTILFISLEMHYGGVLYFVKQMLPHIEGWEPDLHFFAPSEPFTMAHLTQLIEETKCTGIMIDTLSMLTTKSLNDDDTMKKVLDELTKLQHQYALWIWLIHHQRKASPDNKKPYSLNDMYGSQFIAARADTVLCMVKTDMSGALDLNMIKNRYAPDTGKILLTREGNLWFKSGTHSILFDNPKNQSDSTQKPQASTSTTPPIEL